MNTSLTGSVITANKPIGFILLWGLNWHTRNSFVGIGVGEPAYWGKGYGSEIMKLALARCFADPAVSAVLIDPLASNLRARRFYERLGFRFVELRHFGQDECAVYRLDRAGHVPTVHRD